MWSYNFKFTDAILPEAVIEPAEIALVPNDVEPSLLKVAFNIDELALINKTWGVVFWLALIVIVPVPEFTAMLLLPRLPENKYILASPLVAYNFWLTLTDPNTQRFSLCIVVEPIVNLPLVTKFKELKLANTELNENILLLFI